MCKSTDKVSRKGDQGQHPCKDLEQGLTNFYVQVQAVNILGCLVFENAQPFHYNATDNAQKILLTAFQKTFIYKTCCGPGLPYEPSLQAHLDKQPKGQRT